MLANGPLGTLLLVDDDKNIADLLTFNLNSEGFKVLTLEKASDVDLDILQDTRLVIVDAMKQKFNGFDLCVKIKENPATEHIPVIICSDREGEDMIIEAFDKGAEDYITKPFSLRELVARIRAILRRHPLRSDSNGGANIGILTIPGVNLVIDTNQQRVAENGMIVTLTKTEYAILVFLVKNRNKFFNRNEIFNEIWKNDETANPRVVDTNISRMRKKLGDSGKYIINRYGMGYAVVDKIMQ